MQHNHISIEAPGAAQEAPESVPPLPAPNFLPPTSPDPAEDVVLLINDAGRELPNPHLPPAETTHHAAPDEEGPDNQFSCCVLIFAYVPLSALVLLQAATETMQLTAAMNNNLLKYIVAPFSFFGATGLNGEFTFSGVDEAWEIISKRKLPEDWPHLSRGKKYSALILSGLMTSYIFISDGCQGYLFAKELPQNYFFNKGISAATWEFASIGIGATSGICVALLAEGIPLAKLIHELLAMEENKLTNPLKKWLTPNIARFFGGISAFNDGAITLCSLKQVFNVSSTPMISVLAAGSLLNVLSDYALNGPFINDSLNRLINYFCESEFSAVEIISFVLSLGSGGMLTYAWQQVIQCYLLEVPAELGIDISDEIINPLIFGLSLATAGRCFITYSASLYHFAYPIVKGLANLCLMARAQFNVETAASNEEKKPFLAPNESDYTTEGYTTGDATLEDEAPSLNVNESPQEEANISDAYQTHGLFSPPKMEEVEKRREISPPRKRSFCVIS